MQNKNQKRHDDLKDIQDDNGLKPDNLSDDTTETPILLSPETGSLGIDVLDYSLCIL